MHMNLNIQINPLSDIALYEQITEQLKQFILSGTLAEHAPLPSVRGLAQMLGKLLCLLQACPALADRKRPSFSNLTYPSLVR